MTTVQDTVTDASGVAVAGATVTITLIAGVGQPGFFAASDKTIGFPITLTTTSAGAWSTDLVPNGSIVPVDTVYKVEVGILGQAMVTYYMTVPSSGGPYHVADILSSTPSMQGVPILTWEPALTASNVNPVLSTNTSHRRRGWYRNNFGWVEYAGFVSFGDGTGLNAGNGLYYISLPVEADTSYVEVGPGYVSSWKVGAFTLSNGGVGVTDHPQGSLNTVNTDGTKALLVMDKSSGISSSYGAHNDPWTWAAGYRMWIDGRYKAKP